MIGEVVIESWTASDPEHDRVSVDDFWYDDETGFEVNVLDSIGRVEVRDPDTRVVVMHAGDSRVFKLGDGSRYRVSVYA